jgi:hypothetical protein
MNRIIREHYPASRLPDDLKAEIGAEKKVTITIEVEEDASKPQDDWFSRYSRLRRGNYKSLDEVNEHVRALRDEWSDRER